MSARVLLCDELAPGRLEALLGPHGIAVRWVPCGEEIPGSHWGAPEAGIRGATLFVRPDTPVHSALHEGGHLLCMGARRRAAVDTDAGGDDVEEAAVCYLQVLLADGIPELGRARLFADMDAWGYSFRLGSTRRWFEEDAEDAAAWLVAAGLARETSAGALALSAAPSSGAARRLESNVENPS